MYFFLDLTIHIDIYFTYFKYHTISSFFGLFGPYDIAGCLVFGFNEPRRTNFKKKHIVDSYSTFKQHIAIAISRISEFFNIFLLHNFFVVGGSNSN